MKCTWNTSDQSGNESRPLKPVFRRLVSYCRSSFCNILQLSSFPVMHLFLGNRQLLQFKNRSGFFVCVISDKVSQFFCHSCFIIKISAAINNTPAYRITLLHLKIVDYYTRFKQFNPLFSHLKHNGLTISYSANEVFTQQKS